MVSKPALRLAIVAICIAFAGVATAQTPPAPAQGPVEQQPETPPADASPAESPAIDPITVPERPVIVLRGQSKWDEGFTNISAAFSKLRSEADNAKLKQNGKPLAVFVQSDDEGFTFEAMLPVEIDQANAPKLSEGVSAGKSPGGSIRRWPCAASGSFPASGRARTFAVPGQPSGAGRPVPVRTELRHEPFQSRLDLLSRVAERNEEEALTALRAAEARARRSDRAAWRTGSLSRRLSDPADCFSEPDAAGKPAPVHRQAR